MGVLHSLCLLLSQVVVWRVTTALDVIRQFSLANDYVNDFTFMILNDFLLLYGKIMMTFYDHDHIILFLSCFSSLADLFLSAPAEKTEVTTTTCLS